MSSVSRKGFTIVELLIVIVVIAILAAITVVAYNGIQSRARASQLSSALNQAGKKLELYKVDNSLYPLTGNLAAAGVSNSSSLFYQYTSDGATYNLTASTGGVSYTSSNTSTPSSGAYSGHVSGGVITNFVYNPSAFSSTSGWSAWAGDSGGTLTASSSTAAWATRGKAFRATWNSTNSNYNGDLGWYIPCTGSQVYLQPNTQYTASWKTYVSKSQRLSASVSKFCISGGDSTSGIGTTDASSGIVVIPATTPTLQWVTFTTGADSIGAKIYASLRSGTGASYWNNGDYIEMSDFMLVQGSTPYNYADGSSSNWSWNGSAHGSTSSGPVP